jgi:AcrR family transcriptional regulator
MHQQGVERTTLADIAKAADVPVGNVYYYFKTKDEVIGAVVEARAQQIRAMTADISARYRSPKGRLKALMEEFAAQGETVAQFGCPLGSLCSELGKRPAESGPAAADLMRLLAEWIEEQFRSMGRADAPDLALDLVAAYEGNALLANATRQPDFMAGAARRVGHWIDSL